MSSRICETCHKLLNGKDFLVGDTYKRDCNACRRKAYQREYKRRARLREANMKDRVEARMKAAEAELGRSRKRDARDMVKHGVTMFRRIWRYESRPNRSTLAWLRKNDTGNPAIGLRIERHKALQKLYDDALEEQIGKLKYGVPLSSIPHITDIVRRTVAPVSVLPAHLLASMDADAP